MDCIRDPEVACPRFFIFEMISDIEVIDEFTIQLTTDYLFAPPTFKLGASGRFHYKSKTDYAAMEYGATSGSVISENPIGTGYIKFDSWEPGEKIVIVQNEKYGGDLAHVDKVTIKVIPESGTRLAELETGFAHIIEPVQPSEVPLVTESEQAEIDVEIPSSLSYIGFNVTKAPFYDSPQLDQMLDEAREEIDESTCLAIYDEIQSILIEDAPMIYVHHQGFLTGVSNQVMGYWIDSTGYYQLQSIEFIDYISPLAKPCYVVHNDITGFSLFSDCKNSLCMLYF